MNKTNKKPRVLVVDDTAFNRKKLTAALKALGLDAAVADDGQSGLDLMDKHKYDLVLLDIVMPGKDGFDVLREMKANAILREIPVLVISSLDQTNEIALALELGAVDFLPKSVPHQIFKARVEGCLERKRMRDLELTYLEDVSRLTLAAEQMEAGHTNPNDLDLRMVAGRGDGLGALAHVFSELANSVYQRERAARQRINFFQGCLLLGIMGLSWGIVPALSKLLIGPTQLSPIGVAAWVATVTLSCLSCALVGLGIRPKFTRTNLVFGAVTGLFAGVLPQVALFWVSGHVSGIVISITLALESLIVFSIAAMLRIERPNALRFCGLLFGLAAVLIIMFGAEGASEIGPTLWIVAGLIVPLCYAIQSLLVASMPEKDRTSPIELLFFIMIGSSVWAWWGAFITGNVIDPWAAERSTLALIATVGVMSAISNGSYVLAIRKMGAVFASQYAYVVTIMGVGWSVLLLGERLTPLIWAALFCVLIGMMMVRPNDKVAATTSEKSPTVPVSGGSL